MEPLVAAGVATLALLLITLKHSVRAKIRRASGRRTLPWYVAVPLVLGIAGLLAYFRFSR